MDGSGGVILGARRADGDAGVGGAADGAGAGVADRADGRGSGAAGRLSSWWQTIERKILPPIAYCRANRCVDSQINDEQRRYAGIPLWVLRIRLKQEHEGARSIEAKTDRLGQRILGTLAFVGILWHLSPSISWSIYEAVVGVVSIVHIFVAWLITINANATTRKYGVGTEFEFEGIHDQKTLSHQVFCQEMENIKRHNRNSASVSTFRNGVILGLVGIPVMRWIVPLFVT